MFFAGESRNRTFVIFTNYFFLKMKSRIYQEGNNHQEKERELCIAFCSETPSTGVSSITYLLSMWNGNRRDSINIPEFLANGLSQQYVQNWLHHL